MDDSIERISHIQFLERGIGMQYLIDEAYKVLGNPIVLFNMEYELICCTKDIVSDDRLWNEIVENGVFSDETIQFFFEECFIDDVANSKSITILKSDKLKYERLYGRVYNCYNNTVADLIMVASNRPFIDQDAKVFQAVCEKMSHEISESEFYKNYGILYHEKLICKLLNKAICEKVIYSGHLSNLYEDLKTNIYVVVVDICDYHADGDRLGELRNMFKEMQPELKYAVYSDYIVVIASNDETSLNVDSDLRKLSPYFRRNNYRIGISGGFDNLFDMRKYYDEAASSLQ